MCDLCLRHGAGGKWYLNARSYSEEVASKHNLREFLMEQYRNFEQISVRPVSGISPVGMDHTLQDAHHRQDREAHRREHAAQHPAADQPFQARGPHRPGGAPGGRHRDPGDTAPPSP